MARLSECPECGAPLLDGGGIDISCINCGLTYFEMVDIIGEDIEVDDEFVAGEVDAQELGYGDGEFGGDGSGWD